MLFFNTPSGAVVLVSTLCFCSWKEAPRRPETPISPSNDRQVFQSYLQHSDCINGIALSYSFVMFQKQGPE